MNTFPCSLQVPMNESVRGPIDHAKKSQTNGRTITTGASSSNPVGEPSAPMPHASAKNQRGGYDRARERVPPFQQVGPGEQESYRRHPPEDDVILAPGVEKAPGRPRDPRSPRFSNPVCDRHLSSARERPTMNHRFGERHHLANAPIRRMLPPGKREMPPSGKTYDGGSSTHPRTLAAVN